MKLKVWTNTEFTGHYPVGVAAVAVAETPKDAAIYINHFLRAHGLVGDAKPEDMVEIPIEDGQTIVLNDGNY